MTKILPPENKMSILYRWKNLSVAVLAALLAACGGGSSDDSAPVNNNPVIPPVTQPNAPGSPTLTGDAALDGYNWINYRRQVAGLPTLTRNAKLDQASLGHSNYLRVNNTVSHTQTVGAPGFTGATETDRLQAVGYNLTLPYAYGEVISAAGDSSGFYHAEQLVTAIFHRFVLMEPIFREVGVGVSTGGGRTYFTADLATVAGFGPGLGRGNAAVYPAANQTLVPRNFFSDSEAPDPVPNQNEVGYPISIQGDNDARLQVQTFTVRPRGGTDLTVRLLSPGSTDTPVSAAAIIPLSVLKSATVYDVTFTGTIDGITLNRSWSFTTQ
jgi:uncharacterized protein YkwD